MKIVHVETSPMGSSVELRNKNRTYFATVAIDGEIFAVDVERSGPFFQIPGYRFFQVNRFRKRGIPRRITEAVRQALAH